MNRTLVRLPVRLIQLKGSEPAPQQGTDFAAATSRPEQPPPHPLQPSPPKPKRAKGFEPSTFSLGS